MNLRSLTLHNLRILIDKYRGLDFLTATESEDVGLDPNCAYRSCPSGNKYLVNVLRELNISEMDSIIDIGCGKGSAMRTMLKFPFARVHGVELSEHIATIAINNFNKLNETRCKVFINDASEFKDYDAYNIVYFYNPFPENIMKHVINNIMQSILRSERELIIIYNNPECNDVITCRGAFCMIGDYPDEWGNGIFIYSNIDDNRSRLRLSRLSSSALIR